MWNWCVSRSWRSNNLNDPGPGKLKGEMWVKSRQPIVACYFFRVPWVNRATKFDHVSNSLMTKSLNRCSFSITPSLNPYHHSLNVGETLSGSKAPLLLVGRLGNPHLFAASLHHAAFVPQLWSNDGFSCVFWSVCSSPWNNQNTCRKRKKNRLATPWTHHMQPPLNPSPLVSAPKSLNGSPLYQSPPHPLPPLHQLLWYLSDLFFGAKWPTFCAGC